MIPTFSLSILYGITWEHFCLKAISIRYMKIMCNLYKLPSLFNKREGSFYKLHIIFAQRTLSTFTYFLNSFKICWSIWNPLEVRDN